MENDENQCDCEMCRAVAEINGVSNFTGCIESISSGDKKGQTIEQWKDDARREYQRRWLPAMSKGITEIPSIFGNYTYDPEEDRYLALIDAMYDLTQNLYKLRKKDKGNEKRKRSK